jgi:AcrR family transcriptional regulator
VPRRRLIPTAGAIAVGLVASLVLAAPAPASTPGSACTSYRLRGSTVERCGRTGRRATINAAGPRRVISRDQVVQGGCRYFLRYGTLDMNELAVRLSVSRATLYRVVHSRDRLLADVLWRLADIALWRARQQRTEYGVEGVLEVGRRFAAVAHDAKWFRTFLTSEPDVAARVLLTATGGVHHRAVKAQKEILLEATPPGQVWLTGDLDSLAYLLVRIFESTCYADLLASRQPDRELAERAIRAVLMQSSLPK